MTDTIFTPLESDSQVPLYVQVQQRLRDAVQNGRLKPDQALPTERGIAERFVISRVTVRKALEGLVDEGLLYRRQGAGTFVSHRIEKPFSAISSFTEDVRAQGLTPSSQWIENKLGEATAEEILSFGLKPNQKVFRLSRVRKADDLALAVESSIIPEFALPGDGRVFGSLYELMASCGCRPVRALQRLRAISFDEDIARKLGVEPGAAGLFIERRGFLESGTVVELTKSYYRGDAYDFVAELYISDIAPGASKE